MQGGITLSHPVADPLAPTDIERTGSYTDVDAVPTGTVALGDTMVVAFGDGALRLFRPDLDMQEVRVHSGAVLAIAADPATGGVLTAGDDGRLMQMSPVGVVTELARFGAKWVDCVATARNGARACSVGSVAHAWDAGSGQIHQLEHPSTVGGLAFDSKGGRLAVAHYGGVTLWTRERRAWKPTALKWAGSHVGVTFSPDNRFVVSLMQENALHGWRLRDKADMRMSGYPAKVKSVAWAGKLPHLATSGAEEAICWPFAGADGPMGKSPLTLCFGAVSLATSVAALPGHDALLTGFANGTVLYSELDAIAEPRLVKRRAGAAISVLAVTPRTGWMLAGAEDGRMLWAPLGKAGR